MSVKKHEIITVDQAGSNPRALIAAAQQAPDDAQIVSIDIDEDRGWGGRVIASSMRLTFRREVSDE